MMRVIPSPLFSICLGDSGRTMYGKSLLCLPQNGPAKHLKVETS